MKVFPSALLGNNETKISYWKLKFLNSSTENLFQQSTKQSLKNENQAQWKTFQCFHFMILIIFSISYLLQLSHTDFDKSLIFQIVLIFFSMSTTGLTLLLYFSINKCRYQQELLTLISYGIACIILILNDYNSRYFFFDRPPQEHLRSLPGLICIILSLFQIQISKFLLLTFINLVILVLYSVLSLYDGVCLGCGVMEIILLAAALIYQVEVVYLAELAKRKMFIEKVGEVPGETEKILCESENEILEFKINDGIEELSSLLPLVQDNLRYPIEKTIGLLKNLANENRHNLPPVISLEHITRELDEEDKIYIQQSWSNPPMVQIRKREKSKIRYPSVKTFGKNLDSSVLLILKQVSQNWNVNSFNLFIKTEERPIEVVGKYCMNLLGIVDYFQISEEKLTNFLSRLEKNYKKNPYHNATHSTDVLASYLYIIHNSFILDHVSDIEMLASIVATLAHDVGHPGFTNRFLVNFQDKLALQCNFYLDNDISVLENMHCSLTFDITSMAECNIFESFEADQYLLARKLIIELILATDMGKHFDLIGTFKGKGYTANDICKQDCKLEVFKMVIKASDIGHSAKISDLHMEWSLLISEEFYRQGDIERESGRPISMYCDRETTIIPKSQIGFLKNIALPLYESLNAYLNSEKIEAHCVEQIKSNILFWEQQYKQEGNWTLKESQLLQLISEVQWSNKTKSIGGIVYNNSK